jgi:hypothetical protein
MSLIPRPQELSNFGFRIYLFIQQHNFTKQYQTGDFIIGTKVFSFIHIQTYIFLFLHFSCRYYGALFGQWAPSLDNTLEKLSELPLEQVSLQQISSLLETRLQCFPRTLYADS